VRKAYPGHTAIRRILNGVIRNRVSSRVGGSGPVEGYLSVTGRAH